MEFYSFGLMRFVVLLIYVKVITSDFLRIPPSTSDVQNGELPRRVDNALRGLLSVASV